MPQFKLGRNRPAVTAPRLKLSNYLLKQIVPAAPPQYDLSSKALAALSQVYLNDRLGACVIAGLAHVVGVLEANAGRQPPILTDAQIVALYEAIGGYNPSDPSTDNGCDEITALNYFVRNGVPIGENRATAWLQIDSTNPAEIKQCLWLFENLIFGAELSDDWISPFPDKSGFYWWNSSKGPNPDNGHCFIGFGYDFVGVKVSTWGLMGTISWNAVERYANPRNGGGLYCVISTESLNRATQKAANGVDWKQLLSDFQALGGHI